MAKLIRFKYEGASAKLTVWGAHDATLSSIFSLSRGKGHATQLLEKIMDYADKNDLTVVILVQAYHYADRMSPNNAGLRHWYRKFGFVDCGDDGVLQRMIRQPREIQAS